MIGEVGDTAHIIAFGTLRFGGIGIELVVKTDVVFEFRTELKPLEIRIHSESYLK